MRTALYLRVSTAQQKPDLQHDDLRSYARRTGLEIVTEYMDIAVSGRKEGRPQLQALMRAARTREFACVLVWKFDRFARSVAHLLHALDEFNHLGIRFISLQDQIDTQSPMGKAMFTIIGAMAELESALISERVKAGMAAAKARGKRFGRPGTPPHVVTGVETFNFNPAVSVQFLATADNMFRERAARALPPRYTALAPPGDPLTPAQSLGIVAVWRACRPPGERGIMVVWHQQRGQGGVALAVGAIPHEDMGGVRAGHDPPLAVGMRPLPMGMVRDVQHPHALVNIVKRHSVLLLRLRSRSTRRSSPRLRTVGLQKIPDGARIPRPAPARRDPFRGQLSRDLPQAVPLRLEVLYADRGGVGIIGTWGRRWLLGWRRTHCLPLAVGGRRSL